MSSEKFSYKGDGVPSLVRRPKCVSVSDGVRAEVRSIPFKDRIMARIMALKSQGVNVDTDMYPATIQLPDGSTGTYITTEFASKRCVVISVKIDEDYRTLSVPLVDVFIHNPELRVKMLGPDDNY